MRLDELNLSIGNPLQVSIAGLDYKKHQCGAELVGFKKGKSILLHLPVKPPQVLLREGLTIKIELTLPEGFASFESEIYQIQEHPFLALHCDYPVGIDYRKKREQIRIPVDSPVNVVGHTKLNMDTYIINGHMLDVSLSGAQIVTEKELTKMVTRLSLGVYLSNENIKKDLKLTAKIRNNPELSKNYPECAYAYGLEFIDVTEDESLFLRAFCLQSIQQKKILMCN